MIEATVIEDGEVRGLVAINVGNKHGVKTDTPCIFVRKDVSVGKGHVWFTLDKFSSVRVDEGEALEGDICRIE